jgi:hypothetical protein
MNQSQTSGATLKHSSGASVDILVHELPSILKMCPDDTLASITDLPWLLSSVPRLFDCFRLNTTFNLLMTLAAMEPPFLITSETETQQ